jgi:Dynein heavy chain AAA lid domain
MRDLTLAPAVISRAPCCLPARLPGPCALHMHMSAKDVHLGGVAWLTQLVEQLRGGHTSSSSSSSGSGSNETKCPAASSMQPHPKFRLWLTAHPGDHLPAAVVGCALRIALEPLDSLAEGMARAYVSLPPGCLAAGRPWQRAVFGLSLLHGLLRGRRRFGRAGWARLMPFSDADLAAALSHARALLLDSDSDRNGDGGAQLLALRALLTRATYGGHITDVQDAALLAAAVERHLPADLLHNDAAAGTAACGSARCASLRLLPPTSEDSFICAQQLRGLALDDRDARLYGLDARVGEDSTAAESAQLLADVCIMLQDGLATTSTGGKLHSTPNAAWTLLSAGT